MSHLTPDNSQFAIVSFEGPDEYARAGGLAVRVRDLASSLADQGFQTHLFFIGDPHLPGVEQQGNLTLHRWAQWISAYHPGSVYEGEWGKMQDMTRSLPPFLVDQIARPAATDGKVTVLMGEDWQTAQTVIHAAGMLAWNGLLQRVIPVWTANNLYGFEGIDFGYLAQAAAIMTVSRYMKHEMRRYGPNPLVVPNGIAPAAIVTVQAREARRLRQAFASEVALFKIGRYTPDKRWIMALEAVAILKQHGVRTRILIRGDRSPYGNEVLSHAYRQGLRIELLEDRYQKVDDLAKAIAAHPEADVLSLTTFLPDSLVPVVYAAVDGVLANSGHEPFGLVGLEVMGAGGLAFVGSTGEEYAEPDQNAIVLDTDDPREIVVQLLRLRDDPEEVKRLKKRGKETARAYVWSEVLKELFRKLDYVALARGVEVP
ncbi:MAG: glycosyltransferase family 4 protein [Chloroflexi bacterium]|nr:glycosyltransferase family 4 protein [Chloroflexota bacterium]